MNNANSDIPQLDTAGLRRFGITTGALFVTIFGLFFPWLFGFSYPLWPWVIAAVLAIWALLAPDSMRAFYTLWMKFALLLNRVVSPVVMSIVFFVLFVPAAMIMRVIGRDTMLRKLDANSSTYRIESKASPAEKMNRPF